MRINKLIYKMRTLRDLTQKEFGELIYVDSRTVSSYEKGRIIPTLDISLVINKDDIYIQEVDTVLYKNRGDKLMNTNDTITNFFDILGDKGTIITNNEEDGPFEKTMAMYEYLNMQKKYHTMSLRINPNIYKKIEPILRASTPTPYKNSRNIYGKIFLIVEELTDKQRIDLLTDKYQYHIGEYVYKDTLNLLKELINSSGKFELENMIEYEWKLSEDLPINIEIKDNNAGTTLGLIQLLV